MEDAALTTIGTTTVASGYNTTTEAYDAEGALKYTVAVVLVFGVGVIGLLGMYHFRGDNEEGEQQAEEADEFIKRFESRRYYIEKQERKKVMTGLISSIITKTIEAQAQSRCIKARPSLRPTLSEPNLLQAQDLLRDWRQDPAPPGAKDSQQKRMSVLPQDEPHPQLTSDQAMLVNDVFNLLEGGRGGGGGGGGDGGDGKQLSPISYMGRSRAYSTSSPYSPTLKTQHGGKLMRPLQSLKAQISRKREEDSDTKKKHAGPSQRAQTVRNSIGGVQHSSSRQTNPKTENYVSQNGAYTSVPNSDEQDDSPETGECMIADARGVRFSVPVILVNDCRVTIDDSDDGDATDPGTDVMKTNSCVTDSHAPLTGSAARVTDKKDHAIVIESPLSATDESECLLEGESVAQKRAVFFLCDDQDGNDHH